MVPSYTGRLLSWSTWRWCMTLGLTSLKGPAILFPLWIDTRGGFADGSPDEDLGVPVKEKPESEAKSAPSGGRPNHETIQIANVTVRGFGRYAPSDQTATRVRAR